MAVTIVTRGGVGGGLVAPADPGAPGLAVATVTAGSETIRLQYTNGLIPGEPDPYSGPYYLLLDMGKDTEEMVTVTGRTGTGIAEARTLASPLVYTHSGAWDPRYCGPAAESSETLGEIISGPMKKLSGIAVGADKTPAQVDPTAHASTHHTVGSDPITPADIGAARRVRVTEEASARSLVSGDADTIIDCFFGVEFTVPTGLISAAGECFDVEVVQRSDFSPAEFVAGAGMTLYYPAGFLPKTAGQWSSLVLSVISPTEAIVRGDMERASSIVELTGTSHAVSSDDDGLTYVCTNPGATDIAVSAAGVRESTRVEFVQVGGNLLFAAAPGTDLLFDTSRYLDVTGTGQVFANGPGAKVEVLFIGNNRVVVSGDLEWA